MHFKICGVHNRHKVVDRSTFHSVVQHSCWSSRKPSSPQQESSPPQADSHEMSYHSVHISPLPPENVSGEQPATPEQRSPPSPPKSSHKDPKSSLSRAVQNLLSTPQSARGAGTVSGVVISSRDRGTRSPVEPLISSPLRISSSAMASAPSSPERHRADPDDPPRRLSDQFTREMDRRPSTAPAGGQEEDLRPVTAPASQEHAVSKKHKPQGRSAMAAMMSGLESRLFPKSFTRGRDSSRGSSRRGSSADSRSPSAGSRLDRSISPGTRVSQLGESGTAAEGKSTEINYDSAHSKSEEVLSKLSGSPRLPDYIKPTEEESGERLAKDVFDSDKNLIESSEEDDEVSSDDENIPGVQVVHSRGRKKNPTDISSISPSDFKPKDKSQATEARMSFSPSSLLHIIHLFTNLPLRNTELQTRRYQGKEAQEVGIEGGDSSPDKFRHPNPSYTISGWHALWIRG